MTISSTQGSPAPTQGSQPHTQAQRVSPARSPSPLSDLVRQNAQIWERDQDPRQ